MIIAAIQPFDPMGIVLAGILNPVVIAVAAWLGWHADQWQKVLVAGFAAAFAGNLALWLVTKAGLMTVRGDGGVAGVFVVSFLFAMVVAAVALAIRRQVFDKSADRD
ncbi:MAG: hypothetical protein KKB37_16395 [Alphaproteobacteria bacterium]|nr:hypothetical protein [Alphaproteobacteria bacterium]